MKMQCCQYLLYLPQTLDQATVKSVYAYELVSLTLGLIAVIHLFILIYFYCGSG